MNWHPSRAQKCFIPPCGQHSADPLSLGKKKIFYTPLLVFPKKSAIPKYFAVFGWPPLNVLGAKLFLFYKHTQQKPSSPIDPH